MVDQLVVDLSRAQFAITALYHFLFVPLTLGLSIMIAMMETVFVMTGKVIWRRMTKFWGVLFGINFAIGVGTGLTMEFQFGMNWAFFSHYAGDLFGAPLAIEGLMAFFMEATFVGLFFFGWDKLSPLKHLMVTWLMAIATNFSALWILIANGWMQNPVGSHFNLDTMRMEVTSFSEVLFNPVAQVKFVHTVSAGYVAGAMFVLAISAYYMLRGRHVAIAQRSFALASAFGLASSLSVIMLGDESGYTLTDQQQMKLAAMEGMWKTYPAPAPFTVIGWPNTETKTIDHAIKIPWVMGIIATRSFDTEMPGINDLVKRSEGRIRESLIAYAAMEEFKKDRTNEVARATFNEHQGIIGYAQLLRQFVEDPLQATDADIKKAALSTVPHVPTLFFTFRIMVGIGFFSLLIFAVSFWKTIRQSIPPRWLLHVALWSLPLPVLAAQLGWIVAEFGRQPWSIEGLLPTFLGTSNLTVTDLVITIMGFVTIYSVLAYFHVTLMMKSIKEGPADSDEDEILKHSGMLLPSLDAVASDDDKQETQRGS